MQFTSGTTGTPKGATLTHHNIVNNGYFIGRAMRLTEQDRLCIPVPLYHCFGMVLGNLACTTHGACVVYPGEGFDPLDDFGDGGGGEAAPGCTACPPCSSPRWTIPDFSTFDLSSSLRTGIMAGLALPDRGDEARGGKDAPSRHHDRLWHDRNQPGQFSNHHRTTRSRKRVSTVGRIHPHVEVKIVDAFRWEDRAARGTPGELCTRGYPVMLGYWGDDARTRQVIDAARWMHTGDLATIDDDGYCAHRRTH